MIEVKKLSNGIPVILEPMNYLKSVSFGIWIKVGSANETVGNNGISHMIEHMLFKGTKGRTAKMLADDMAKIGGNMNAFTGKECTSIYVTTLEEHLPETLALIGDMVCNSRFDQSDIEKEKGVIGEEIDMYNDSAEDLVHEMLQYMVWEGHPLGFIISGEKEIVNQLSKAEIMTFMEQYYNANHMVISLAGGMNTDKVMSLLEHSFGGILGGESCPQVVKPAYHRCFYSQNKDMEQVHMNIAFEGVDYMSEEKYVMSILNSILGGSENSILFQMIREELGLTYSIYSYGSSYEKAGLFHIEAVLNSSKLLQVFHKIFEVIDKLKQDGLSEEELLCIKEQIKTEMIINNESTKTRMYNNGKSYLSRGAVVSIEDTIESMNKVTVSDVKKFMDTYFVAEKCSISLVGNLSQVNIEELRNEWNKLSL